MEIMKALSILYTIRSPNELKKTEREDPLKD
jgi:hypothetical protein